MLSLAHHGRRSDHTRSIGKAVYSKAVPAGPNDAGREADFPHDRCREYSVFMKPGKAPHGIYRAAGVRGQIGPVKPIRANDVTLNFQS